MSEKSRKLIKSESFVSTYSSKRSKSFTSSNFASRGVNIIDSTAFERFPSNVQEIMLKAVHGKAIYLLHYAS